MSDLLPLDKIARMSNDELAEVAKKMTGRLNNEDWQRFIRDLQVSGHVHTLTESAPVLLQRFSRLEIDLDAELSKRSASAPILSELKRFPDRPRKQHRYLMATITSQDKAAEMSVELDQQTEHVQFHFTIRSMLSMRFELPELDLTERRTFLDMMARDTGINFLWTRDRWERDFLIFVRQEHFTRLYAFSQNLEATARTTSGSIGHLMDWLEKCWFPRGKRRTMEVSKEALPPQLAQPEPDPALLDQTDNEPSTAHLKETDLNPKNQEPIDRTPTEPSQPKNRQEEKDDDIWKW